MRMAERIAVNRTVAGVHFPVDSAAGMVLARTLAEFFLARFAGQDVFGRSFDGRRFAGDFRYEPIWEQSDVTSTGQSNAMLPICRFDNAWNVPVSPLLRHLWQQAQAEWLPVTGDDTSRASP